mgnify:FL=1
MRKINKKSLCLAAAALTLTAGISAGTAMAYFTTYTEASGGVTLNMGFSETIPKEDFSNWTKHVSVENTGDYDCYIRVKALAGSKYQDGLQYSDSDGKWTPGEDGYYYYSDLIAPGESTSVLDIRIDSKESDASFNVVVVQESTKVLNNENNEPYADWTQIADTSETTGE